MVKIFSVEEIHYQKGLFRLVVDSEKLEFSNMRGSWYVLPARLLNLNYPTYLRMCRDLYGAIYDTSGGRKGTYWMPRFQNKEKANELAGILNKIINEVERAEKDLNFR